MRKTLAALVAIGFLFGLGTTLQAAPTPPKKPIVYPREKQPPPAAVFEHSKHSKFTCADCHPKTFKMKAQGTGFTMADINMGKACGVCHNGTKAFAAKDKKNCSKCHTGGK